MPIHVRLARLLGERKLRAAELSRRTGINKNTVSALWNERSSRIGFDTLEKLCRELHCEVGDIIEYVSDDDLSTETDNDRDA
ncbi:MAG: helix-turn-helix transcriptional regulator [Dehalococcoidia bacterium]|nr:helix-turn-helix transcriptional regulator [Dehalococcoidia bacterium]